MDLFTNPQIMNNTIKILRVILVGVGAIRLYICKLLMKIQPPRSVAMVTKLICIKFNEAHTGYFRTFSIVITIPKPTIPEIFSFALFNSRSKPKSPVLLA